MSRPGPERETLLSIGRKWLPWCMGLIFALTIGWIVLVARDELAREKHESVTGLVVAVVKEAAPAEPLIVICAIFLTTALDMAGGAAVVTARFLTEKFLEPQREKLRKRAREQGLAEGREEGIEQGREQGLAEGREQGIEQGLAEGREQGIEQGLAEGREQGIEQGRRAGEAAMLRRWTEWNGRRVAAERMGLPFDEPPPGA